MARDYKPRGQPKKKGGRQQPAVAVWRWALVASLVISFIAFLVYLRINGSKQPDVLAPIAANSQKTGAADPKKAPPPKPVEDAKPKPPHFEFYTVLPDKEVVVPEHEIKTRSREERVGKAKESHYVMQAGSFKSLREADQLRAKLALMGIESKVEKAKIGDTVGYRVKLGPYTQVGSVDLVRNRLRKNGIDAIVTESSIQKDKGH
ncbi:MAG: SPOR domain-containing protein [Methylovulum sp.]|nr:SPOR domain-containing protein [Methylovulum sp.]